MKRFLDICLASLALVLASPLALLLAVGVKLTSSGPLLFGHRRVGAGNRDFRCLKFRTMVEGAERWLDEDAELKVAHRHNGFKLPSAADPRVTGIGQWLRRSQLDELPQLWNVVRGDMSLVGPRPLVEEELHWFPGEARDELLSVRPGIFGPWTARGRDRPNYPERAAVELGYVREHTILGDLAILVRHVPVLLRGQSDQA